MCLLILEILMLIAGLYALIAGKVTLSKGLQLQGTRARIAGLFLVAPLPLALVSGVVLGILVAASGSDASSILGIATVVEVLIVLGCLAGAVIYALATKPSNPSSPPQP